MNKALNKEIGLRLTEIREENDMIQKDVFGTASGQKKLSKVENGEQKVDPEILIFWHNKGYNLNWIVTGMGPKKLDYSDELISLLEFKAEWMKKFRI